MGIRFLEMTPRYFVLFWFNSFPDSKVHGANMGPIWGRQDPGGPHVGPKNFVIWVDTEWWDSSVSTGSGNGLLSVGHQAITWTNDNSLSIRPWGIYFNEILFEIHKFPSKNIYPRMSSEQMAILFSFSRFRRTYPPRFENKADQQHNLKYIPSIALSAVDVICICGFIASTRWVQFTASKSCGYKSLGKSVLNSRIED